MKLAIILNTNDAETVWNAFRFATTALRKKHDVAVFLLGKGVECEKVQDKRFDVQKTIASFKEKNGRILACGSCLRLRGRDEIGICPVSSMDELLQLVEESDKVLTFDG